MANQSFFKCLSKTKPAALLLAGCFLFNGFSVFANSSLETLDDLKAVNVVEFTNQLKAIEEEAKNYSAADKEYFDLLKAYQLTLTADYATAKISLVPMVTSVTDKDILIRVKALLINVQVLTQEYRSAFTYLDEITRSLPNISNRRSREHALSVMAYSYNQLEEFATAKFYSQMLIDTALSERAKCHGKYHLISSLFGLQAWTEFSELIEPSVEFCLNLEESIFGNLIRAKNLEYMFAVGHINDADNYYQSFKTEISKIGYPILSAGIKAHAAQIRLSLNDEDDAMRLASQALAQLNSTNFTVPLQNTLYVLYKIYERKNDKANALDYYIAYSEAKQAISDNRFAQQQAYHAVRAEVEVKNQRIALLDKDNELLYLQKNVIEEEVRQTRVLMAVLALVLSIAVFLAYKGLTGRRRFKKIAEFDQLTGISNRYHFNNQAVLALEYCEKNKQPAAVILFDLDHFKQINDTHGHAAGDWALQAVVSTCRHFMRNNDVFGRIGGEEFAVVLPGCQTDKAALLAEICRDAIAAIDTEESGTAFPLTASFGVSGSDTSGYQLKQLLADADNAMYRAKDGGRDQVASFGEA